MALRSLTAPGSLARLAGDLLPIVGVLALGWSATAVLALYLLELAVICLLTVLQIPFARKRPNNAVEQRWVLFGPLQAKRGATHLPGPLPPVYLRNLPTLIVGIVLMPVLVGLGVVLFALTRPTISESVVVATLLGGPVVLLGRGVETWRDYGSNGGYRDHSPRSVLLRPVKYGFILGSLFLVFVALDSASGGPLLDPRSSVLLLAVGKLGYDVRLRVVREQGRRGLFTRLYGSERSEIEPDPVETPDRAPVTRYSPPRHAVALDAVAHGLRYGFLRLGPFVWGLVGLGVIGGEPLFVVAGIATGAVFTLLRAGTRYLRYGTLVYHCYEGTLVATDVLLDEPQSRMDTHTVVEATVTSGWVDRVAGTETLVFEVETPYEDRTPERLAPDPATADTSDDANRSVPIPVRHVRDATGVAETLGLEQRLAD